MQALTSTTPAPAPHHTATGKPPRNTSTMTTNPTPTLRPSASSTASDTSIPDLSRSGSVMDATTWRLNKLKCRLEDEEATMHKQLRHFYDIKQ